MEDDKKNSVGIVETKILRLIHPDDPMDLQCGKSLAPIDVAYETYGEMTPDRDNVVLICHALSGNAHVAGYNSPEERKPGWWDIMVGPGKAIDTDKYFVICSNVLGGISGTTGPSSINPVTQKPYGLEFPIITIADMVRLEKRLLDKLEITEVLAVVGGSMGGMQAVQWSIEYPDFVKSVAVIASTTRLSAQGVAFDAVGRNAILVDGNFNNGQYHDQDEPVRGLAIARMIGHITYLSEESMREKFGRTLQASDKYSYDFDSEFSVETYLDYQGQTFIERFDANCYLYITKAMDYFDLFREYGTLNQALANTTCRFLVVSFTSDWLFTVGQSEEIVNALSADGKDVSFCNIESPYGHDAFLLEPITLGALLKGFIDSNYKKFAKSSQQHETQQPTPAKKLKRHEQATRSRLDYELIDSLIEPKSRVLDIGCGDGELLSRLIKDKQVKGEGIELDQDLVVHCINRGVSVIHRDIERGLDQYPTDTFDYAILSQTLQTVKDPEKVFKELLRVANKVIISFPNFGHYKCRLQLLFKGRAPRTKQLPFRWYDSPNIHCLTLKDFDRFCEQLGATIEKKIPLGKSSLTPISFAPNIFATQAVYVTSKYNTTGSD